MLRLKLSAAVASIALIAACGNESKKTENNTTTSQTTSTAQNTSGATNTATNNTTTTTTGMTGGTTTACVDAGTECFSNDECPDNQRCDDVGAGVETPQCVCGARGAGVPGDMCTAESDCASGVCIGRNDDPNVCSEACIEDDDTSCSNGLECVWVPGSGGDEFWCVTPRE